MDPIIIDGNPIPTRVLCTSARSVQYREPEGCKIPRYWVCNRCGTYNIETFCDTCGLDKSEAVEYEEIREVDPSEAEIDDQEDWLLTSTIFEDEEDDNW